MSDDPHLAPEKQIENYLESIQKYRNRLGTLRGAGKVGPEFWADAPWRIEPGQTRIPLCFIARDAVEFTNENGVELSLDEIRVTQWDGVSNPGIDLKIFKGPGQIKQRYWHYKPTPTIKIPRGYYPGPECPAPGKWLRLKVEFCQDGSPFYEQHLCILIAKEHLPLKDSPSWFYGDTHYHSSYTNDIKEFGNPISDTRAAACSIGLDWLILTDHSVDLDDKNPFWGNKQPDSRWEKLGKDVEKITQPDKFRLIRGEEVSVQGVPRLGNNTLHMLVFGDKFTRMLPGAFLNIDHLTNISPIPGISSFTYLFGKIYSVNEILTEKDENGNPVPALEGRSVLTQEAVAFAAHPTYMAQGPYGTWLDKDLCQPINGMEAWNTRIRKHSRNEENPIDNWHDYRKGKIKETDAIDAWDKLLVEKADGNQPGFVLIGGSDAHGSFNYGIGMGKDFDLLVADDNCLGKVRTLIYLPDRDPNKAKIAPTVDEVVNAIRKGSCVVTDGPAVNFSLHSNGNSAKMGGVLEVPKDTNIDVQVQAWSSGEFGVVKEIRLLYFAHQTGAPVEIKFPYVPGNVYPQRLKRTVGTGYMRLEAETTIGEESYRCVTNPIWFTSSGSGAIDLCVRCI